MKIAVASLLKNPANPRTIKDNKFKQLVKSIQDFPQMMVARPIIIDEYSVILGGNMRYAAIKELGFEFIPAAWVKQIKGLSEERKKEFVIKDNISFGSNDWEMLANEWDQEKLTDWGMDIPNITFDPPEPPKDPLNVPIPHFNLKVRFTNQQECQRLFEELAGRGLDVKILK